MRRCGEVAGCRRAAADGPGRCAGLIRRCGRSRRAAPGRGRRRPRPAVAVPAGEPDHAQRGPVALLGVRPVLQDLGDRRRRRPVLAAQPVIRCGSRPRAAGEIRACAPGRWYTPAAHASADGRRPAPRCGRSPPSPPTAARPPLAGQLVGADGDVLSATRWSSNVPPGLCQVANSIPGRRQWPQRLAVQLCPNSGWRAVQLMERPGVDLIDAGPDRGVRLAQGEDLWSRSRAIIDRSAISTPVSALALSRGLYARAGMIATA